MSREIKTHCGVSSGGLSRRQLIITAAKGVVGLSVLGFRDAHASDLPLSPDEGMGKSMGYVDDASSIDSAKVSAYKAGAHCSSCALFQGAQGTGDWGPCLTFSGKAVNQHGWCMAYAPKA